MRTGQALDFEARQTRRDAPLFLESVLIVLLLAAAAAAALSWGAAHSAAITAVGAAGRHTTTFAAARPLAVASPYRPAGAV